MLMSLDQVVYFSGGHLRHCGSSGGEVDAVVIDSRYAVERSLFVPLRGEHQDGHLFIPQAVDGGAVVVFADMEFFENAAFDIDALAERKAVSVIEVTDTLAALQNTAAGYIRQFSHLIKIAVTGSNGKTTTKEILKSMLSQKYNTIANAGNLNSETGLPLSVFNIRNEHEIGVFECGMNHRGEMRSLACILNPDIALITNISSAHIGILGSIQAIVEEKKQIFSQFSKDAVGFVPSGKWESFLKNSVTGVVYTHGLSFLPSVQDTVLEGLSGASIVTDTVSIYSPLSGAHNVENVLAAMSVAAHLGIDTAAIKCGVESVEPLFGRSQCIYGNVSYFLDCYNANPDSMSRALMVTVGFPKKNRRVFVIGSMLELGSTSAAAHEEVCRLVLQYARAKDLIYFFGDDIADAAVRTDTDGHAVYVFRTAEYAELEAHLDKAVSGGDFVFLKGSRGLALERLEVVLKKERRV